MAVICSGLPKDAESAEWFDVTWSPLDPELYGNAIGKDKISAIDDPVRLADWREKHTNSLILVRNELQQDDAESAVTDVRC